MITELKTKWKIKVKYAKWIINCGPGEPMNINCGFWYDSYSRKRTSVRTKWYRYHKHTQKKWCTAFSKIQFIVWTPEISVCDSVKLITFWIMWIKSALGTSPMARVNHIMDWITQTEPAKALWMRFLGDVLFTYSSVHASVPWNNSKREREKNDKIHINGQIHSQANEKWLKISGKTMETTKVQSIRNASASFVARNNC